MPILSCDCGRCSGQRHRQRRLGSTCHWQAAAHIGSKTFHPGNRHEGGSTWPQSTTGPKLSKVVSHSEWIEARRQFLAQGKEFTRLRDELSRQRRELPWEKVEKNYVFEGPRGKETLADLFDGRSQLVIYHFMFGPGWAAGCPSCSYLSDHFDGMTIHLAHRDVTLAVVSRAPYGEIDAFKKRMGWRFHWAFRLERTSITTTMFRLTAAERATGMVDYNYAVTQFPSEERPGASVFFKDADGQIYHTYSVYARGLDILIGAYNFLDLVPKGRDEEGLAHPWRGFATTTNMTAAISSILQRSGRNPKRPLRDLAARANVTGKLTASCFAGRCTPDQCENASGPWTLSVRGPSASASVATFLRP